MLSRTAQFSSRPHSGLRFYTMSQSSVRDGQAMACAVGIFYCGYIFPYSFFHLSIVRRSIVTSSQALRRHLECIYEPQSLQRRNYMGSRHQPLVRSPMRLFRLVSVFTDYYSGLLLFRHELLYAHQSNGHSTMVNLIMRNCKVGL